MAEKIENTMQFPIPENADLNSCLMSNNYWLLSILGVLVGDDGQVKADPDDMGDLLGMCQMMALQNIEMLSEMKDRQAVENK